MLEQVYNAILNIPETVIVSIPGLKSPSVLTELKRMRQKIKNKIKLGETRLVNELSKPSTSDNKICNSNSTNYGSDCTNSFKLNTFYNQTNIYNDNNTTTNKWFDNQSDFHMNTISSIKPTSNNSNIYSRERLSINELNYFVNDNNFDSFSISDVQKSTQCSSVNNNKHQTIKQLHYQNTSEEGKN